LQLCEREVLDRFTQKPAGTAARVERNPLAGQNKISAITAGENVQPIRQYYEADFRRFVARFDQKVMERWLQELLDKHNSARFADRKNALLLADHIRALIAEGRPASLIRIGDGEGDILAAMDAEFRNLQQLSANRVSERHLGRWHSAETLGLWNELLSNAVIGADVIGIPCMDRIPHVYRGVSRIGLRNQHEIQGICGTINALRFTHALLSAPKPDRIVANCWFHRDLLPHYSEMLSKLDRVGLISCYLSLPKKIMSRFDIGQVDFFRIPNQVSNSRRRPEGIHYPDRFSDIIKSLGEVRPGQVVLVAAGFLGKIYCERVKQAGGIGIDIGSVADVWMGESSRRYHDEAFVARWRL
jgi:hypothetical protein